MTNKINGIDVSECSYYNKDNEPYCCEVWDNECEAQNCYFKQLKRLQEENEKIKKQYNCYACGNCNGTEDYINLEKHHKGLRKQFDELVKRNNTLSLRIEELEKENEKSKEWQMNDIDKLDGMIKFKGKCGYEFIGGCRELKKYKQALEEIREIAEKLITETPEYNSCYYKDECGDNCTPKKQSKVEYCCYENVDKILTIINEVLNEQK